MEGLARIAKADFERPIETVEPLRLTSPLVFSSPHSGSIYPERFLVASRLELADVAPVGGCLRR